MYLLIALNHPAHYHLFKNFRKEMIAKGNKVIFFIKEKEIIGNLLADEGVEYEKFLKKRYSRKNKISIIGSNIDK